MPEWMSQGRTGVVTGAAGGIGFEIARRFVRAGMQVAITDVKDTLSAAHDQLASEAPDKNNVFSQICDVSDPTQMAAFKNSVTERFAKVHCLVNNAGVATRGTPPWEGLEALDTIMGINFKGVVHGCHAFIPDMLAHGEVGAVINTGSKQGITRPPGNYAYNLSKAAVVAYTEAVSHAFVTQENCQLSAHLLVPAFVYTPMISAFIPEKPEFAATAEETVDYLIGQLKDGAFYIICPDGETNRPIDEKRIQWAADDIIKNRPAMSRWHPDFKDEFEAFMST